MASDSIGVVRRFAAAFNERDEAVFVSLLAPDVEFRNPLGTSSRRDGTERGRAGGERRLGVYVQPDGAERDDGARIAVPVRMHIGADGRELSAAGVFEVHEGRIVRFDVVTNRASVGL